MLKGATARRYAAAVFELGVENGNVDRWRDDLRTLAEYFGNRRLMFILREPKVSAERKELIVRDLLADKLQPEAFNLALLLVERGLVELAPAISTQFERQYNDYRGQAVASVTTAIPLDDSLRMQLTGELQQLTGKRILLEERVDPSILGGAIARVGDTLIDGSLRRRFLLLRQEIASGSFGGPDDGSLAALGGPDGGSGDGDGNRSGGGPHESSPTASGPTSSTEMAPRQPRSADAPRLAPLQGKPGAQPGNSHNANDRRDGRPRRRRR